MRKLTSYLLISLLFCAACVKIEQDTPGQDGQERAFVFSARLPDGEWIPLETKADASMSDLQDNANGNGWGVYAYYTGTDNYTNPGDVDGVIFNIHKYFQDCLKNDKPIRTPLDEGIKVLKLSTLALESSREHKEIILDERM